MLGRVLEALRGRLFGTMLSTALAVFGLLGTALAQTEAGWVQMEPLLEPRSEIAIAELDGRIYVMGGYPAGRVPSAVVQVYDVRTSRWEYGPPLPVPMHHAMPAVADDRLFLIGGEFGGAGSGTPSVFLNSVYELDPVGESWLQRSPMPTSRSGGGTAVIDGKIYVAGGRPPGGNDFAVYDPARDAWETLPDVPTQRNHLAVVAIDGKVYVAGGRFGGGVGSEMTAVLEVFDPATNAWTTRSPMPAPRAGVSSIAANGCLYVIGGEGNAADPRGIFEENEAYDPRTDTWHRLEPMPIPTHGLTGAAFVDGWIHVPGGAVTRGGDTGATHHQAFRATMSCG